MKHLFFWLLLTTACCLITIHIFSLSLQPSQIRPNALRLITSRASSSFSEATLSIREEETQTDDVTAKATTHTATAATRQAQTQTPAPARKHRYGFTLAIRELMLVVTVANPMFLGGVIGMAIVFFKFVYGERVAG
ncbi:hypothetical protein MFRU_076g00150 [Monilinia fructicola]|nr:hypothetical protein MFRU_076g00150 [Monilinia fructicola]